MIIGVTGRIASGKSTLADILEKSGYLEIDADKIYHGLRNSSVEMMNEIKQRFNTLDTSVIVNEISFDGNALSDLNAITHKYVVIEIDRIIDENKDRDIVLNVPVPIKRGFIDNSDYIIVTDCDEKTQVSRIMERDLIDEKTALKKISIQKNRSFYRSLGDAVINTCSMSPDEMKTAVDSLLRGFVV